MQERIEAILRKFLPSANYRFGFADLRGLLGSGYERFPSGISILRRLEPQAVDSAEDLALPPTLSDAELDANFNKTLRAPVSHKMLATRSGLGWIGKTDLLVSSDFGPRVRLASVLLGDALPRCGPAIEKSRCGSCGECVRACPARAATGLEWRAGMDRDEFFQAHKCRENCKMLSRLRLGEDVSICGICVSVCPRGKPDRALTAAGSRAYTAPHA